MGVLEVRSRAGGLCFLGLKGISPQSNPHRRNPRNPNPQNELWGFGGFAVGDGVYAFWIKRDGDKFKSLRSSRTPETAETPKKQKPKMKKWLWRLWGFAQGGWGIAPLILLKPLDLSTCPHCANPIACPVELQLLSPL